VESEMPDQPILHSLDFRLSYGDCDPAGIVYYAAYYPWFERVYSEWTYLQGFPTSQMPDMWGVTHISVASSCDYRRPGLLFDPFTVSMRLGHVGTTSMSMAYDVSHRENGFTYAEGKMTLVFVDDSQPLRSVAIPEEMKMALRQAGCYI
jgi:YbgC/YbaW family acyl-CoA thioester hydrolase